ARQGRQAFNAVEAEVPKAEVPTAEQYVRHVEEPKSHKRRQNTVHIGSFSNAERREQRRECKDRCAEAHDQLQQPHRHGLCITLNSWNTGNGGMSRGSSESAGKKRALRFQRRQNEAYVLLLHAKVYTYRPAGRRCPAVLAACTRTIALPKSDV
ncbi:unnamed protein product, partial [Ectocarpus sp. 13 AM-2016]